MTNYFIKNLWFLIFRVLLSLFAVETHAPLLRSLAWWPHTQKVMSRDVHY